MGTNYYLQDKPCKHCGKAKPDRHIGKSSYGWHFTLHVYPDDGINDLSDWEPLLKAKGTSIIDEYGEILKPKQMKKIITERRHPKKSIGVYQI